MWKRKLRRILRLSLRSLHAYQVKVGAAPEDHQDQAQFPVLQLQAVHRRREPHRPRSKHRLQVVATLRAGEHPTI